MSPDNHSSTVATLHLNPCSLLIFIGLISSSEPVRKFSIPFLVDASFVLLALEPVVFCIDPSVKNLNRGPFALVIAVRAGDSISSACFIVGAVVIWCVVLTSTFK